MFVNDEEVIDATSSFNSAATRHGVFCDGHADHVWRDFGGWVSLFHGVIDAIHPRPRLGAQYCYIRALDDMERLTSVTMYTYAASQFPQSSDEILDEMLDHAAAAPNRRRMDAGVTLVPSLWSPSIWGVRGIDEIYRLQEEEDGLVFVDGHGYWRLESRSHRTTPPHTSSRATIKDTDDGGNPYFSELVWDDGVDNIENAVFMRIRDASHQGLRTAWTLKERPFFAAYETKDFLAESADYDMLVGQLRPRKNTDYQANTSQSESGTDISGELTVTHPSPRGFRGKGTLIRVRFGATAGYLTLLKLRTLNAYLFDDPLLVRAEDAASKENVWPAHQEHRRPMDSRGGRGSGHYRKPPGPKEAPEERAQRPAFQRLGGQHDDDAAARLLRQGNAELRQHGHRPGLLHRRPQAHSQRRLDKGNVRTAAPGSVGRPAFLPTTDIPAKGLPRTPIRGGNSRSGWPLGSPG